MSKRKETNNNQQNGKGEIRFPEGRSVPVQLTVPIVQQQTCV